VRPLLFSPLVHACWYATRRDHTCYNTRCSSSIQRTVWDGDQVLHEIRSDGGNVSAETLENDARSGAAAYGRVLYTHGAGIDHPLSVVRVGYTPTSLGAEYEFNRWGGPWAVIPLTDYRGTPVTGTVANGRRLPCELPSSTCALVEWATGYRAYYSEREAAPQQSWFGSLVRNSADGSGLMYRRNRYYNPATGLFTQPDPIGLAGGLNTYGFADGDPVSYSDPYGLSAEGNCLWNPAACIVVGTVKVAQVTQPTADVVLDVATELAGFVTDVAKNTLWAAATAASCTCDGPVGSAPGFRRRTDLFENRGGSASSSGRYSADGGGYRARVGGKGRLTNAQAKDLAGAAGYDRTVKSPNFNSRGQPVFTNGQNQITPDVDSHVGGVWKMFSRCGERLGTYDAGMNRIGN